MPIRVGNPTLRTGSWRSSLQTLRRGDSISMTRVRSIRTCNFSDKRPRIGAEITVERIPPFSSLPPDIPFFLSPFFLPLPRDRYTTYHEPHSFAGFVPASYAVDIIIRRRETTCARRRAAKDKMVRGRGEEGRAEMEK